MSIGPSLGTSNIPVLPISYRMDPQEGPKMIPFKPGFNFVGGVSQLDLTSFFLNSYITMIQSVFIDNSWDVSGPGDLLLRDENTGYHVGAKAGTQGWYPWPMNRNAGGGIRIVPNTPPADGYYNLRLFFTNVGFHPISYAFARGA